MKEHIQMQSSNNLQVQFSPASPRRPTTSPWPSGSCTSAATCQAGVALPSKGGQRSWRVSGPVNSLFRDHSQSPLHRRPLFSVVVQVLPGGGGGGSGKIRRVFVCSKCGARYSQYHGKCSKCGVFGTINHNGVVEEPPALTGTSVATAGGSSGVLGGRAGGGGGGGAGMQALQRVQQDTASVSTAQIRKASSWSSLPSPSYSGVGTGGDDYMSVSGGGGGGRAAGWVGNGGDVNGSGGGSLDDVPLSLRALSQLGLAGLGREGRIPLSGRTGAEVQRVLGGGVVPGALVLIGGDPGVGKSTIALQIAAMMAHPELDYDALEKRLLSEEDGEDFKEDVRHRGLGYGSPYYEDNGSGIHSHSFDDAGLGERYNMYDGARQSNPYDDSCNVRVTGENSITSHRLSYHGQLSYEDTRSTPIDSAGVSTAQMYDNDDLYGSGVLETVGSTAAAATDEAAFQYEGAPPCGRTVLYVTAEETREQVFSRSHRMGLDCCDRVVVLCRCEMSAITRAVLELQPDAVVMDSINTVFLSNLPQAPGTVTQIRECGQLLLRLAKDHRVAVFIIGHVTKAGEMAGPNMLAHMVDTVLYLEGDVAQSVRLVRVVKNRHGSDTECGVFMMDAAGLHAVANHSALFLENRIAELQGGSGDGDGEGGEDEDGGASSVVGVTLQGSRAILVEVQALVSPLGDRSAAATSALSYRSATGVDKLRLANLCSILDKHVPTLELSSCSVIVNVVGGTQVRDVASDLALAVAIASSYYNAPVPRNLAVCGEVDLAGRVRRSFQRLDVRVREAAKLGFKRVVIPQTKGWELLARDPKLLEEGVEVVAVRSVAEALRMSLGADVAARRPAHIPPPAHGKPPFGIGPPGSRFSRQNRTSVVELQSNIATDSSLPRAAALGGAAAAYAAAKSAPLPIQGAQDYGSPYAPSEGYQHDDDERLGEIGDGLVDGSVLPSNYNGGASEEDPPWLLEGISL
ncbi:hypothetical protein VaNZ11_007930 [Volvox africanus]|uniref:RecA family profile 1 domain-containing protein n=1 Tax=Volvox africanus TaxID=51714 RepID=A0ABQ5S5A5_9CHLO|nr:hypothetical protein VaNZ11_007930 [Volvox africanus]